MPLDPDYPAERLAFMIADARVSVVVTQEAAAAAAREHGRASCGSTRTRRRERRRSTWDLCAVSGLPGTWRT